MLMRSRCLWIVLIAAIAGASWGSRARAADDDIPKIPPLPASKANNFDKPDVDPEAVKKAADERVTAEKNEELLKKITELMKQTQAADEAGKTDEAIALATEAQKLDPKNAFVEYVLGFLYEDKRDYEASIEHFSRWMELNPAAIEGYDRLGNVYFKMGKGDKAVEEYDRFLRLYPERLPHHWRRGIALVYAGRYDEARDQFEKHSRVNADNAENAAWHFLAVAKGKGGMEEARKSLIPVAKDERPVMMAVYSLLDGRSKPEDVLKAAQEGDPDPEQLKERLYYANFYLWLYYQALGDESKAQQHLFDAVDKYGLKGFVGDVGRTFANRARKTEQK